MAYGLVVQFHPKIKGELLDYVLNEVMQCNSPESDGEYYVTVIGETDDLCSERYFDERHTTFSNCKMAFKKLKKFMALNPKFWKDAILYSEIQFIDKKTDYRDSYPSGI